MAYLEGGTTPQDDVTLQLRGCQRRFGLINVQNLSGGALFAATNQGAASVEGAKNQGAGGQYLPNVPPLNMALNQVSQVSLFPVLINCLIVLIKIQLATGI